MHDSVAKYRSSPAADTTDNAVAAINVPYVKTLVENQVGKTDVRSAVTQ